MVITQKNILKVAVNLEKKTELTKQEKLFLKFFSCFYFLVKSQNLKLDILKLKDIFKIKIKKSNKKIKKLKISKMHFNVNDYNFNIFRSNIKCVLICKSGYIRIYEKRNFKQMVLKIDNENIFSNSHIINLPNKTIFLNKKFRIKFIYNGNKLTIESTKFFDFISSKKIVIECGDVACSLTENTLHECNFFLDNLCTNSDIALKMPNKCQGTSSYVNFDYEVSNLNQYIEYFKLKNCSFILDFFNVKFNLNPLYLNGFKNNFTKPNMIMKKYFTNKNYISESNFVVYFNGNSFNYKCFLDTANFKLDLELGVYKVVKTKSYLKVINLITDNYFYINFNNILKGYEIIGFQLILNFKGDIRFSIANNIQCFESGINTNLLQLQLEKILSSDALKTLQTLKTSIYSLEKIDDVFYEKLKVVIKNKESLNYISTRILELCSTAKAEENAKLFKLIGLLRKLPERTVTINSVLESVANDMAKLKSLSICEQLEVFKQVTSSCLKNNENCIKIKLK